MSGILFFLAIYCLSGIGPALWLQDVFRRRGLISFLCLATILGSLAFDLTLLTLGHLGFAVTGINPALLCLGLPLGSLVLLGVVLARRPGSGAALLAWPRSRAAVRPWARRVLSSVPLVTILAAYFVYMAEVNVRYIIPAWDDFTYWLVDAKEIFDTGHLRHSLDVTNLFAASSYYPLRAAYLWDWYGYRAEAFASQFTLLQCAFATYLAYRLVERASVMARALATVVLLVVTVPLAEWQVTYYADCASAFCVTLFVFVLLQPSNERNYLRRAFLVALSLVALGLVKATNIYYVAVLLGLWLLHDLPWLRRHGRRLERRREAAVLALLLGVVLGARWYYVRYVLPSIETTDLVADMVDHFSFDVKEMVDYTDKVFGLILSSYKGAVLAYVTLLAWFLSTRRKSRSACFLVLALLILPGMNVTEYLVGRYSLVSRSVLRYISTVFYLLPMLALLAARRSRGTRLQWMAAAALVVLSTLYVGAYLTTTYWVAFPRTTGAFADHQFMRGSYSITEKIRRRIGDKSVLFAGDIGGYVSNMAMEVLPYRYFLSDRNRNGLYQEKGATFPQLLDRVRPDYVAITSYNDALTRLFPAADAEPVKLFRIKRFKPFSVERVPLDGPLDRGRGHHRGRGRGRRAAASQ